VVPSERLIEELWGGRAPATAAKSVQVYVSQLRKTLGDRLVTRSGGYMLELEPGALDLDRFQALAGEGRELLARGEARRAAELLGAALALWRGPALVDFSYEPFAQTEIQRLEELRLTALEDRIEADLALGRHAQLVAELEALVLEHPLRERLRGQLMLALYRSGRQGEALEVYREARELLVSELGIEPGPGLQELHRAILNQDPALEPPSPSVLRAPRSPDRRRVLIAVGGAMLLASALSAFVVALTREGKTAGLASVQPNSVAVIDPDGSALVAQIPVGARPAAIAAAGGTVWVSNVDDSSVSRIDAKAMKVVRTIALARPATALAADRAGVWATGDSTQVYRIARQFDAVSRTVAVQRRGRLFNVEPVPGAALGAGSLWAASGTGVVRIAPRSGRSLATVETGDNPTALAYGAGAAWVTDAVNNTVTRIDRTGATQRIEVGSRPTAIAVGAGAVWVANALDDTVVRLDPFTRTVEATIPVGRAPSGLAVTAGVLWVANSGDGTVSRIDPATNEVAKTVRVGGSAAGIASAAGSIWVTIQDRLPLAPRGGSILVLLRDDPGTLDPALAFWDWSWQVAHATCVKLMNYPDRRPPAGLLLRPEAAAAPPEVTDGGRTYSFTVRRGYRFSPPSNEPVTAETFRYSIERATSPEYEFPVWFLDDVVGMKAYRARKARHLAGVAVRGNNLVIRLTRPSADLATRLAMPFFCAVPRDTPIDPKGVRTIPSAGPYYVSSYIPGRRLVLRRNPNYRGVRSRSLDAIIYAIGATHPGGVADIERGTVDYIADGIGAAAAGRLGRQFGPGSDAATQGRQRLFVTATRLVGYLALNARRPLFRDARMRRAFNYAIDRGALARLGTPAVGDPGGLVPTDQYLSPAVPGFRDVEIYPLDGPDLAAARRLAGGRRGTAVLYTCDSSPCPEQAEILRRNLRAIGISLEVRQFPLALLHEKLSAPDAAFDIGRFAWIPDYPDPANVLGTLFRGGSSWYPGGFADPRWNLRLDAAEGLRGVGRYRTYGRLDAELASDAAPAAAVSYQVRYDFFSNRVGCQLPHPVYGMDLAALCLRRE
ncbi:MAG: winged helix-turn-helix domain-containing protein, partial [Actinobacteria bacterium]|nr:winged helix-turn-helix domain-containing protein [Actinomycetota bacterium]